MDEFPADGVDNAPTAPQGHGCSELRHVGNRMWECRAQRCFVHILTLSCEVCEPPQRATRPHTGIYWASPPPPQQRVLPHESRVSRRRANCYLLVTRRCARITVVSGISPVLFIRP
jgi:hypothetical protein